MFANYLKTTIGNIKKQTSHSLLMILGLAVGFAASIIIFVMNYRELHYDHHWADADRIFQIEISTSYGEKSPLYAMVPAKFYNLFQFQIPEVEKISRWWATSTKVKRANEQSSASTFQERMAAIDDNFFKIFNYSFKQGNPNDFYGNPDAAILSEETSIKLFGTDNPIGKTVTMDITNKENMVIRSQGNNTRTQRFKDFKIVAVLQSSQYPSSLSTPGIYVHTDNDKLYETETDGNRTTSYEYSYFMYVKLKRDANVSHLHKSLPNLMDQHLPRQYSDSIPSKIYDLRLINIKDVRFKGATAQVKSEQIWVLYALAAIMSVIATINYINLALAAYSRRQKEIALRKTMGASTRNIAQQFLAEALIFSCIALIFSFIIVEASLPWLRSQLQLFIQAEHVYQPQLLFYLFTMALMVGLACGTYPSFYLSKSKPADILKANKSIESPNSIRFRKTLVLGQFVISGVMLCFTAIVATQMYKIRHYDPGYQTKNIMFAAHESFGGASEGSINALKRELSKIPGIEAAELSMASLMGRYSSNITVTTHSNGAAPKTISIPKVDLSGPQDLAVLNVKLVAGKYFSALPPSEASSFQLQDKIYINQQALAPLGFKNAQDALNQKIDVQMGSLSEKIPMTIMGVTEAVHVGSLNSPPAPCIFWPISSTGLPVAMAIRYSNLTKNQVSDQIKSIWNSLLGYSPNVWAIEDSIADEYKNENLIARFVYFFTGIAIFISCLGLYGLATHATNNRKKEISLRKIHGASVSNIMTLLIWQFSKPVLFANLIAWPIALFAGARWLEKFHLRIDIWTWGPLFCLASGLLAALIAWLTVASHTYWVARDNPVEALREE